MKDGQLELIGVDLAAGPDYTVISAFAPPTTEMAWFPGPGGPAIMVRGNYPYPNIWIRFWSIVLLGVHWNKINQENDK